MTLTVAVTSDERALATQLASLDDDALHRLFAARGVSPTVGWRGFFDAAAGLLDEASVDRALARLPRATLIALGNGATVGSAALAELQQLALVDPNGAPYRVVRARVDAAAAVSPEAFVPHPAAAAPPATDDAGSAVAAERALTAVAALADLIVAACDGAITTTAAGTVSAADRKRLVDDGIVTDGDELEEVLAAGSDAGLVRLVDREWEVTADGDAWLPTPALDRWLSVARGFRAALPRALHTSAGGYVPSGAWADAYPLDPEWPARAVLMRRRAERWGLEGPDGSETDWGRALREGAALHPGPLLALLPVEIDRVYLQADLSAIAPGPLQSALDLRLRGMAARESRAQASTYRFTTESLGRAVAAGETAESIRAFLSEISLTGIPQPLDYLIDRAARHSGRIRVRWDAASARTHVHVDDPHLRETIAVDRGLRAVGLVVHDDELVSRVGRDPVYWSLVDSRYPAIAVDDDGTPLSLRRRPVAAFEASANHHYDALVRTLRAASGADTDAAWLERELDQAVRSRALIEVAVRLPGGEERSFTLEAAGLGGGRLRGRDRAADVERTLPVSSIMSVRPAS